MTLKRFVSAGTSSLDRSGDYRSFLKSKRVAAPKVGFDIPKNRLNLNLLNFGGGWQADVVQWSLRLGRALLSEDCGLGKTIQQLAWSEQAWKYTGKPALIFAPILVGWQTVQEAERFAVDAPIKIIRDQSEMIDGINVINYERLHLLTDPGAFGSVVLDEGSILKNFMGKRKRLLNEMFSATPYRLSCTATPAPNDLLELGNQAEFLGVMPANEMISRWFTNDSMHAGNYRLKKHGAADFWRWVSSWAIFMSSPADLGFSDEGFKLPPLNLIEQVQSSQSWFGGSKTNDSATNVHREKRSSLEARARAIADLVLNSNDQWAVWVGTNYEADAIMHLIGHVATEVRGTTSEGLRELALRRFQSGDVRAIVTKSKVAGFGLNWQHCHKTTWFAGYSFEEFYQAIRRLYRFGQAHPVDCHLIASENELSIVDAMKRKAAEHEGLRCEVAGIMRDFQISEVYGRKLEEYRPCKEMQSPSWLTTKSGGQLRQQPECRLVTATG